MKKLLLILALLLTCAAGYAQCPATDPLTGSGALNSSNWTASTSGGTFVLQQGSGTAFPLTNNTSGESIWIGSACNPTGDQQITVTPNTLVGGSVTGPAVRADALGNGYFWLLAQGGIVSLNAFTFDHNVSVCPAYTGGHAYKLVANGSTITGYDNGVAVCSGTDTTYATGHPAMWIQRGTGITDTLSSVSIDVPPLAAPAISPGSETSTGLNASITGEAGSTQCYAIGATPTATTPGTCDSSPTVTYTTPIPFTSVGTFVLNAISTESGRTNSPMSTVTYVIRAPETWYIRLDGGTNSQCTGLTNHALAGATGGSPPLNCAFNHPYQMIASNGVSWISFAGGDTMQFADSPSNTTPYYMGEQNAGLGTDWSSQIPGTCPAPDTDGNNCVLPLPPSGSAAHHTRILGQNNGACHLSGHNGLVTPTILSGINEPFSVINAQSTDYLDVSCIEVTQPDNCTISGNGNNAIDFTSLATGTGSYIWHNVVGNIPLVTQRATNSGTTNGGGALNGANLIIQTNNPSTLNITSTQATSSTTIVFGYTVTSGEAPVVGQSEMEIAGTTGGGGQGNSTFGFYCGQGASVTAVSGAVLGSGTFTITSNTACFTTTGMVSESGTAVDPQSGVFTVTGLAGSATQAAETGVMVPSGFCTQADNYILNGLVMDYFGGQGPSNMTLTDFAVVGSASRGILGSHLNQTSGDVFTGSDIYIIGSGFTGWDADSQGCSTCSESVGTENISYAHMEFSGCTVALPRVPLASTSTSLQNQPDLCFTQGEGGQGDGWVQIAAGNLTLNIDHSFALYNTQDGFDLLHLSDDNTTSPIISVTNLWSEGNLGQTIKLGGATSLTAINNVSISNCRFMAISASFPLAPTGWAAGNIAGGSQPCRASGDQWSFQLNNGTVATIENNTTTGYGATMYDFGCAFFFPSCGTTVTVKMTNNISKGYTDPGTGNNPGAFIFNSGSGPDMFANAGSILDHNLWNTMRSSSGCGQVFQPPEETNCTSADPLLVSESNIDTINPALQSGSPAITNGTTPCPATGYNGVSQTSPCTQGAFPFGSVASHAIINFGVKVNAGAILH